MFIAGPFFVLIAKGRARTRASLNFKFCVTG